MARIEKAMGSMAGRKRDGFYKRDGSPFWWTRDPVTGKRCSTGYRDLDAARKWRAARERIAADPAHAAAEAATLGEWCGRFVAWKEKTASPATVSVAKQKLGHWIRLFNPSTSLSMFSEPSSFDSYVNSRRSEGASDHTISKEVAHMLAVLKLAKRGKCFAGDLSTLRPPDLHAGYKPRERTLTGRELVALLAELEPRRAVWVLIGVALGCRLGEVKRLLPTDFDWENNRVLIRGTKTTGALRWVPILSIFRPLLERALPELPVAPWGKIWRDLKAACKRAGIAACSTNDFRRTHATLLTEAGVEADVIFRLLGHTTRVMTDRTYAKPSTAAIGRLAEGKLGGVLPLLPPIGSTVVTVEASQNENQAEAPVAQWIEQRFPKAIPHVELDAGILGFRGDARRWFPPGPSSFARSCQVRRTPETQSPGGLS